MGILGKLATVARGIDLVLVDRLVAALLTVAAIADAASQPHRTFGVLAIVALVVLTGSVAWRRADPVRTTAAAISGLILFTLASRYHGDGSFEVAAVALNLYTLGRGSLSRARPLADAALLAYWLAGAVVVTYVPAGGTVGGVVGGWALVGVLPFVIGRTLERRGQLARELAAGAARLRGEQELRARRAAAEERTRMARELHDVVSHCVSVMVVQTGAARSVARVEVESAREALRAVQAAGREALVELRRIVGVVRRGRDDLAPVPAPGLAQLGALVERSRAAGLPVELHVAGRTAALPPALDLVAYRVVQEALTNSIKHAGPACAEVNVEVRDHELELTISDTGTGGRSSVDGSGHGLTGMTERVQLYGGELHAGPRLGGGFDVNARIPLSSPTFPACSDTRPSPVVAGPAGLRWRWLDPLLAAVSLVVLELAVFTANHRRGPLALNIAVVAGIGLAAASRRRSPLLFLVAVGVIGSVMNAYLVSLSTSPLIGAYFVLVPSYAVAAWAARREALFGVCFLLGGAAASELVLHRGTVGDFAGAAFAIGAAWAAGRAIRSYRLLVSELERTSARLVLEREDRARLAVAGERSRISRDLHAAVAASVAAMVVQAEAACTLLGPDPERADAAMDTVERTGRATLAEMRGILGVLRHGDDPGELAPQPGLRQIYTLIQRTRELGRPVELRVDGDAGTLAAGVELGLYRILEDALQSAPEGALAVALRFGHEYLELCVTAHGQGPNVWPTDAMCERVALCGGELDRDVLEGLEGWRFGVRLPRGLTGALA